MWLENICMYIYLLYILYLRIYIFTVKLILCKKKPYTLQNLSKGYVFCWESATDNEIKILFKKLKHFFLCLLHH